MELPNTFISIQPSISHYREPLINWLKKLGGEQICIGGKLSTNESKRGGVKSASPIIVSQADVFPYWSLGKLGWERGLLKKIVTGREKIIIIEGNITLASSWIAPIVGRILNKTILFWGHGWRDSNEGRLRNWLRRLFYRNVDGILVYGERAKKIGATLGFPSERIHVVYNSIYETKKIREAECASTVEGDAARIALGIPREHFVLISSSRLTKRRKLGLLLTAIGDLPQKIQSKTTLLVVGDGPERPELEEQAKKLIADVRFLGPAYDFEYLRQLYSAADFCAIAGWAGLNVIQSLGFGCPVIAPNNFSQQSPEIEAVIDGETGFLFDAEREGALGELISDLALKVRRSLDKQRCVNLILEKYTAEAHAERIISAIRKTAKHTKHGLPQS